MSDGKMLGRFAFTETKGWRHRAKLKRIERRQQRRKEARKEQTDGQ